MTNGYAWDVKLGRYPAVVSGGASLRLRSGQAPSTMLRASFGSIFLTVLENGGMVYTYILAGDHLIPDPDKSIEV